jgi:TrbB protein
LYVFEDPNCPNCQRLDPALNALSDAFNVVVFPVAVIGKEKSIAAITPVLCLPPEQRKAAWTALFDPAVGGLTLGSEEKPAPQVSGSSTADQPGPCDTAQKALGINQVAYQAYRIPGTPWVISDDGRYVPQALLKDPRQLQTFMNEKSPQPAQESSDAAQ